MNLAMRVMAGICFCARTAPMASHNCCARPGSDARRSSFLDHGGIREAKDGATGVTGAAGVVRAGEVNEDIADNDFVIVY